MAASNRAASISKTLTYEGGYTDNPRDPGGATNHGITIGDARAYWKPNATKADVKEMPIAVAIGIYQSKYWHRMNCDARPIGPDFVDFDYGVNSGVGRVNTLRRRLDPLNLSPINYVKRACAARMSFLHALRTFSVFGKGWSRRVADVEATGVRMAVAAAGKPVAPSMESARPTQKAKLPCTPRLLRRPPIHLVSCITSPLSIRRARLAFVSSGPLWFSPLSISSGTPCRTRTVLQPTRIRYHARLPRRLLGPS